jgi:hypothetical protein
LVRDTVQVGSPVTVRVDLANFDPARGTVTLELAADGSVVAERTVAVGASTERTVTIEARFDGPGEYALDVNGVDAGTVVVTEATSEATPPGTGTPDEQPPDVADEGARSAGDRSADPVRVDLDGSASNGTASTELEDSLGSENVSLRRLDVSVAASGDADGSRDGGDASTDDVGFVVTRPIDSVPETARELDAGTAVQYFTLRPTNDSRSEVETVDLQFEVNVSALPTGTSPDDVVLYHYTDGVWVALPTAYDASTHTYTATVDGFSPFAVGVSSASTVEGGTSVRSQRGTEASEISPASQESRDPATGTATPAESSGPAVPWLFWSGLGGFALLFVLFLARNRVPFGGGESADREPDREGPLAVDDRTNDRTPGGGTDDD